MKQLPLYVGAPTVAAEETTALSFDNTCQRCKLHEGVKTVCMQAELGGAETGATLYVVGGAPIQDEDVKGRPFSSGTTGAYVRDLLQKNWPGQIVLDQALRCAPGSRKLLPTMLDACRPYTAQILQQTKPDRIIAFGSDAIASIVGRRFPVLGMRRGYTYTSDGTPVFFLLHPVSALRNRFLRTRFEDDLKWALTANPQPMPTAEVYYMVTDAFEARVATEDLRSAAWTTFDLETFGAPHNREFEVINAAFTPGGCDTAYVLDVEALKDLDLVGWFQDLLEDDSVTKVGHNLKFDCIAWRAKFKTDVRGPMRDTMLDRAILDADAEKALENCQPMVGMAGAKDEVSDLVSDGAKRLRKAIKNPAKADLAPICVSPEHVAIALKRIDAGDEPKRYSYAMVPQETLGRYNASDTISTDRLKRAFDAVYDKDPVRVVWPTIGQPLFRAITQMEFNGIGVSLDRIRELQLQMGTQIDELRAKFAQYGDDFNPNSADQVADLLFNKLGLKAKKRTAGGKAAVDKEVLANLNHPVANDILALRRAVKFKGQYADGMEGFLRDDMRIHPSINISGTETGRPSCSEPNLLNIPRAGTPDGKLCRDIFVTPAGFTFVEADYSQVELRVAAMLSGDEIMLELFKSGKDFHLETAKMIAPLFGINPDEVDDEHPLRSKAKTVNFATLYGDPPAGLAVKLNISVKEAEKLQRAILGTFKKLAKWIQESLAFAQRHGHCRTWWDGQEFRRRPLWKIADHDEDERATAERSAWNTPVQGTAAEFTNASLGAIQQWLEDSNIPAKLVLTVYDSILLEVRDDHIDLVAAKVRDIMQGWNSLGVPIKADFKTGKSWGSLEKYKFAA